MTKPRTKQPRLHCDEKCQFRWETYFVGGKQKRRKIRTVDGMDAGEFIRANADDIWLKQEGYFEILHERELERNQAAEGGPGEEERDLPF